MFSAADSGKYNTVLEIEIGRVLRSLRSLRVGRHVVRVAREARQQRARFEVFTPIADVPFPRRGSPAGLPPVPLLDVYASEQRVVAERLHRLLAPGESLNAGGRDRGAIQIASRASAAVGPTSAEEIPIPRNSNRGRYRTSIGRRQPATSRDSKAGIHTLSNEIFLIILLTN